MAAWIDNDLEGDVVFGFKGNRFFARAQTDQHHASSDRSEFVFFAAQLRHLVATKRSAVMAKEDQDQRLILPESSEGQNRSLRQGDLLILNRFEIDGHDNAPFHRW